MTYEYACGACGHEWESEQSIRDAPLKKCPKCGKLQAKRQISKGAGFILKGGGWYADGYGSSSSGSDKKSGGESASSGSEKKASSEKASSGSEKKASESASSGSEKKSGSDGSSDGGGGGKTSGPSDGKGKTAAA